MLSSDTVTGASTQIGDTLVISEGSQNVDEVLVTRTYTVVGFVHSSYYVSSTSMGSTSVGSGSIQQYMFVSQNNFLTKRPYTEAFVAVEGASEENASSDEYHQLVSTVQDSIAKVAPQRERARAEELRSQAQDKLDVKQVEFECEKSDAMAQLAEAKRLLDEACETMSQSEKRLSSARDAYQAGVADIAKQRAVVAKQLSTAERQVADGQAQIDAAAPTLEQSRVQLTEAWAQWQEHADFLTQG